MSEPVEPAAYLQLADWRRRVVEIYARWRQESESEPEGATLRLRAARDELFRRHPQTPLPADSRSAFAGVPYYGYDPAYRLRAIVERVPADDRSSLAATAPLALPVSGDEPFAFRRIGLVRLDGPLAGASLSLFWMEGYADGLFLPFRDATSGAETYGAGRYLLDTVKGADQGADPVSGELVLDFNLAYHPSCAYDPRWNCPLAPRENWLTRPVPVGERLG